MGRGGRDTGIAARGCQPFVRERRVVVGVDKIVRHPGMLRVLLEELF